MKRLLFLLASALFVLFAVRCWRAGDNDFLAYYQAGTRVLHGVSPYSANDPTPFRYLPITAFFFSPLSIFPMKIARLIFFVLNFSAAFWIYREIFRRAGSLATLLLIALFFRFHNHDFQNSQINPILLLLFFFWWKTRETNLLFATLAFSIFGSFKIIPFAIGLPLLLDRRWREISWIGLWTVVLNFLPVFFIEGGPFVFRDWYVQAKTIGYPAPMMSNIQALPSALWWHLQTHMDQAVFAKLMPVFQLVFFASVSLLAPGKTPEERMDWRIAGTLAATVLLAPLGWKHNYLQFLPLAYLWFREDPTFRETRTRIVYGVALFGMSVLPSLISVWNREAGNRLYVMVWGGVLTLFLSLRCYRSRSELGSYPRRLEV